MWFKNFIGDWRRLQVSALSCLDASAGGEILEKSGWGGYNISWSSSIDSEAVGQNTISLWKRMFSPQKARLHKNSIRLAIVRVHPL